MKTIMEPIPAPLFFIANVDKVKAYSKILRLKLIYHYLLPPQFSLSLSPVSVILKTRLLFHIC
jgi:hypothetical protein